MHTVEQNTVESLRELTLFALCPFNQLNRLSLHAKIWIHPIGIIFAGIADEAEEQVYSHRPFLLPALTALLEDLNYGAGGRWDSTETITGGWEWHIVWNGNHMNRETAMGFLANDRYKTAVTLTSVERTVPARLVGSFAHLQAPFAKFEAYLASVRWTKTIVMTDRATILAIHWFPAQASDALEQFRDELEAVSGREWESSITKGFTYVWCRDRWADHSTVEGWFLHALEPEPPAVTRR